MTERVLVTADTVYDGDATRPLRDRAILIDGGRIVDLVPAVSAPAGWGRRIAAAVAAPGFIDLQINGGGGVLFNDAPTQAGLAALSAAARQGGTAHLLPTFITAPGTGYVAAMDAVRQAIVAGMPGILGLHLEGPFLSPARPGIHPVTAIRPLTDDDIARLCAPVGGPLLLTLAPEEAPDGAIARLTAAGVRVLAGHTEATFDDMHRAAAAGLAGGTHLFNAMSQLTGRAPGAVGALLDDQSLFAGIIADGHHVDPVNLRLALRTKTARRLFLVTDAMPTLAAPEARFAIGGRPIALADGRLTDADGRLAGAHLAMDEAVRNARLLAGASVAEALRMASATPADALGLGRELGRLAPGMRGSVTLLDAALMACATVVDGRVYPRHGG